MSKKDKNSLLNIQYSRTLTSDNLSKAANYVGEYVLKGLGTLGKFLNAGFTSPTYGTTGQVSYARNAKDAKRLRELSEASEQAMGKAMTWVSPLNYGTAVWKGHGLDARKGEEEVASWSPAWQAIGRLGELYVGPKTVKGVKSAPRVIVNTAAKAGSKAAKKVAVAREIRLGIKLNTKNGRIEVTEDYFNSPDKWYRITETPEKYGIMELGKNVTTHDAALTVGTINGWRSSILKAPITKSSEGFIKRPHKIEIGIRRKNGQAHGNTSQAAKGKLWGGTTSGSNLFPEGVIEGQAPSMINYGIDRTNFVVTPWEEVPNGGRVGFHTGEMPMSNLGWFQRTNKGTYTYEPIIPEKRITYHPILLLEPLTSLKFFERKPSKSVTREYVQSPKDITSDVGDLIAEGSERSVYASKSNPNIVYKIEDGNAPLEDINNIKIRSEINDDIIAPETTIGYYKHKNGKYYRVTQQDKYKSYNPDNYYEEVSPELNLEIIDVLLKSGWKVNIKNSLAATASKNGVTIGNLEHFNWGKDSKGNLKLIDLYVVKKQGGKINAIEQFKQGGKMNILEFLKKGSGIHIKKENRGKFTDYCGGTVTDECIRRGKNSSSATIRKRATFADNARHFKHKKGGKAFVEGVNVLDSNLDAYKYVKKKYKMRSAAEGMKMDWIGTAGNLINNGMNIFKAIKSLKAVDELKLANASKLNATKNQAINDYYRKSLATQTDKSDIVNRTNAYNEATNSATQIVALKQLELDLQVAQAEQANAAAQLEAWTGAIKDLGGLAINALNKKGMTLKAANLLSALLNNTMFSKNVNVGGTDYKAFNTPTYKSFGDWADANTFKKEGTIDSNGFMNTRLGKMDMNFNIVKLPIKTDLFNYKLNF